MSPKQPYELHGNFEKFTPGKTLEDKYSAADTLATQVWDELWNIVMSGEHKDLVPSTEFTDAQDKLIQIHSEATAGIYSDPSVKKTRNKQVDLEAARQELWPDYKSSSVGEAIAKENAKKFEGLVKDIIGAMVGKSI